MAKLTIVVFLTMILGTLTIQAGGEEHKSSLIRAATGVGIAWLQDDHVDFKENDGRIYIENDSRYRPEALVGVLIRFSEFKLRGSPRNLNAALKLSMTEGGSGTVDGVFVGVGLQINPALVIVGGFSRRKGKELSPGFQRAMGREIQSNPEKFGHIHLDGDGQVASIQDYDGLPIPKDLFAGEPIIDSFNTKWSIGIMVPLDLWKAIKESMQSSRSQ